MEELEFKGTPGEWQRKDLAEYAEIRVKGIDTAIALVGKADDANLIAYAPELLRLCIEQYNIMCFDTSMGSSAQRKEYLEIINKALNIQ